MKLSEFIARFEALGDEAFLANFTHPFLLEAGRVLDNGPSDDERELFLLRGRAGGRSLVLGRSGQSDLRINVAEVSSQHTAFVPPGGDDLSWTAVDLKSTNGTFVDGKQLEPGQAADLVDLSAIRFGPNQRYTFMVAQSFLRAFRRLAKGDDPDTQTDRNFLLEGTDPNLNAVRDYDSREDKIVPAEGDDEQLLLCCQPFDPIPLELGQSIVIGRSPKTAMMVLPHKNVSRQHTEIVRRPDGVYVHDMGSANGTFIGKTQVGKTPMQLLVGKTVSIGPYQVRLEGPKDALTQTTIVQTKKTPVPLEGRLEDTPLLDLFNEIEAGQITGSLEIKSKEVKGTLTFRAGEPQDAKVGKKTGDEALALLMDAKRGPYLLRREPISDERSERKITRSFSELALDEFLSDNE